MKHYLLSIYSPEGDPPPPEVLDPIMENLRTVQEQARAAGVWVFSGGLAALSSATVLQQRDGKVVVTDGPYLEGKEHLGGFTIITAPDLDAALAWGHRYAEALALLPIEIRPFEGEAT